MTEGEFNRLIGANIRRARQAVGLSQRALGAAIGFASAPQMCRLEQGKTGISVYRLQRAAAALGLAAVSLTPRP